MRNSDRYPLIYRAYNRRKTSLNNIAIYFLLRGSFSCSKNDVVTGAVTVLAGPRGPISSPSHQPVRTSPTFPHFPSLPFASRPIPCLTFSSCCPSSFLFDCVVLRYVTPFLFFLIVFTLFFFLSFFAFPGSPLRQIGVALSPQHFFPQRKHFLGWLLYIRHDISAEISAFAPSFLCII